jgi:group II intron reverse transcriptase/maturase
MKQANKAKQAAEPVEGRGPAKGNATRPTGRRTQSRVRCPTAGLAGVRAAAGRDKDLRLTALLHHVSVDLLRDSYSALKREAAPGVDDVTWQDYGTELEARLEDLHGRVHRGAYRAKPSKRVLIPKPDGRERPLGIASLEDKIVQRATVTVLESIYETDFLGFSYGFRPGRSQHDALDALYVGLCQRRINWVLDADVRGFFDTISHEWLMKFLEHRIGDPRVLRLIRKWLRAGVSEAGRWSKTTVGTPQGSVISPLLGNVYLHYVFDLWAKRWRRRHGTGDVIIVRYADDFVVGFQRRSDAERFLRELQERFATFGLELHPEKTRLLEFGRYAAGNRQRRGERKPETFDFLGFTHYCGKSRAGRFSLKRKPMSSRMRRKLREVRQELRRRRHWARNEQGKWLRSVVQGWMNYYAVPDTCAIVDRFRNEVKKSWRWALHRQSEMGRRKWTWARMRRLADHWLPKARILHPYPDRRLIVVTQGRSRMR